MVVCDGFVGNVVLKTCEGVFEFLIKVLHKELLGTLDVERGKAAQVLQELGNRYDYSAYGGAPLLGIDGICIICHGSSGDQAIKNALGMAAQYARAGLNELIVKELEKVPTPWRAARVTRAQRLQEDRHGPQRFSLPRSGAQAVGMGQALAGRFPSVRRLYDEASAVLGYDLADVCWNGPKERLDTTAVSQPALFVASFAALEALRHDEPDAVNHCVAAAGLSLGEYTALAFAEA